MTPKPDPETCEHRTFMAPVFGLPGPRRCLDCGHEWTHTVPAPATSTPERTSK